jgi:hypothetical protein
VSATKTVEEELQDWKRRSRGHQEKAERLERELFQERGVRLALEQRVRDYEGLDRLHASYVAAAYTKDNLNRDSYAVEALLKRATAFASAGFTSTSTAIRSS